MRQSLNLRTLSAGAGAPRRPLKPVSALLIAALLVAAPAVHARPVKSEATVQLRFGVEMALKGSWREAAFRFEKSLRLEPENAFAQNNLGVASENIGDFEKAKTAYEKALALDPQNARIRENCDRLIAYLASRNTHLPPPKKPAAGATPTVGPPPSGAEPQTGPAQGGPPTPPDPNQPVPPPANPGARDGV